MHLNYTFGHLERVRDLVKGISEARRTVTRAILEERSVTYTQTSACESTYVVTAATSFDHHL